MCLNDPVSPDCETFQVLQIWSRLKNYKLIFFLTAHLGPSRFCSRTADLQSSKLELRRTSYLMLHAAVRMPHLPPVMGHRA